MKRLGILTSLALASSLAFAAPALAAVPGNDTYAGRTKGPGPSCAWHPTRLFWVTTLE